MCQKKYQVLWWKERLQEQHKLVLNVILIRCTNILSSKIYQKLEMITESDYNAVGGKAAAFSGGWE